MKYISGLSNNSQDLLQALTIAHSSRNYDYIKDVLDLNSNTNDEIVVKRINIDEFTKTSVLDRLYVTIEDVVNRSVLIDNILNFCINENILDKSVRLVVTGTTDISDIYAPIEVSVSTWRTFKNICRSKNLKMNNAFKIAIYEFLNNRSQNSKR